MPRIFFVGVDVGTSSARAALVNSQGQVIKQHQKGIKTWTPHDDHYEQSSDEIWDSVCECVQNVTKDIPKDEIVGMSFDATCSLVVLGCGGRPLSVSTTGENEQNIILWMDHRATKETDVINATKHDLLKYVGGQVSVEMEMPKLLWLKNNLYISCWTKIGRVFDLPDFLTWRATGCDTRSLCSVVCKWNYDAINNCWSEDFLKKINLAELCEDNFEKIGSKIQEPGTPVGYGLSDEAAFALGLMPRTYVGTSLIDAHAGALGVFGCNSSDDINLTSKLALICGTSTCHMSLTKEPYLIKGVWGPYKSAVIPNYFLSEAGQSATGALLDFLISTFPRERLKLKFGEHIFSYLNKILEKLAAQKNLSNVCYLTKDIHVWPDFHGNRSPIADPDLKGMVSGLNLNMNDDADSLAVTYLAYIQALAYGTRHIIETLLSYNRPKFSTLLFCGGLAKNQLYVQTHADACNLSAIVPNEQEMVLVGSAMLGACAARVFPSLEAASQAMGGKGRIVRPNQDVSVYHEKKYQVFLKMLKDQRSYKKIMYTED